MKNNFKLIFLMVLIVFLTGCVDQNPNILYNSTGSGSIIDTNEYTAGNRDATTNFFLTDININASGFNPNFGSTGNFDFTLFSTTSNCYRARWGIGGNTNDWNTIVFRPLGSANCRIKSLQLGTSNIAMNLDINNGHLSIDSNNNRIDSNTSGLIFFDGNNINGISLSALIGGAGSSFDTTADYNLTGDINIGSPDKFQTEDANVIDDINVGGEARIFSTLTMGGLGASTAIIDFCLLAGGCKSISALGASFSIEDDWNPSTNNTLTLGTTALRWNAINVVNLTSSAGMIFNVGTATDNNFTFRNASAGSSNISVDGNIYDGNHLYVEKTATIHQTLIIDQNIRVPDENKGFLINGKINIGTIITAGTSGATYATNASIPIGAPLTCLFVLDIAGNAQSCSSALIVGSVWAKVS